MTITLESLIPIFGDVVKLIIMAVENAGRKDKRKREEGEVIIHEAEKAMLARDFNKLHRLIRRVREL